VPCVVERAPHYLPLFRLQLPLLLLHPGTSYFASSTLPCVEARTPDRAQGSSAIPFLGSVRVDSVNFVDPPPVCCFIFPKTRLFAAEVHRATKGLRSRQTPSLPCFLMVPYLANTPTCPITRQHPRIAASPIFPVLGRVRPSSPRPRTLPRPQPWRLNRAPRSRSTATLSSTSPPPATSMAST
jgi:hypothetical protein